MKRISIVLLILVVSFALVGCDENHITLTQSESDAIAQYSAYLMLKYDQNKTLKNKLLDYSDYDDLVASREAEEIPEPTSEPLPTPVPTAVPTAVPTDVPQQDGRIAPEPTEVPAGETDGSDVTVPAGTDEITPEPTVAPTTEPAPVERFNSIGECYNNKLEIQFVKGTVCDSYRSELEYFSINPPKGQKLLVVDFKLVNTSSTNLSFKSSDYNTVYRLYTDGKSYKEPRLTLIANDLCLLNTNIEAGQSMDAVLIYFIEDEASPMTIKVSNKDISEDKTYDIIIK